MQEIYDACLIEVNRVCEKMNLPNDYAPETAYNAYDTCIKYSLNKEITQSVIKYAVKKAMFGIWKKK